MYRFNLVGTRCMQRWKCRIHQLYVRSNTGITWDIISNGLEGPEVNLRLHSLLLIRRTDRMVSSTFKICSSLVRGIERVGMLAEASLIQRDVLPSTSGRVTLIERAYGCVVRLRSICFFYQSTVSSAQGQVSVTVYVAYFLVDVWPGVKQVLKTSD